MTTLLDHPPLRIAQANIEGIDLAVDAALFFLDGHYLFRYREGAAFVSKYVTSEDVAAAFTRADLDTGWQPAGIVRQGRTPAGPFFVYSPPPQKVEVRLSETDDPITIPIPRTVLLGVDHTYYLWALRDQHFNHGAPYCRAPFPNVYPDGKICWGSMNSPPEALTPNARAAWELFFRLPFNRDLSTEKSRSCPADVGTHLRSLADKRTYPVLDMILEDRDTIGQHIDRVLRG